MNQKKIIISTLAFAGIVGAVALSPIGASALTAHNGNGYGASNGLETKAATVGMTTEQLSEQLKTKTMAEIIAEKGLSTEDYQAKMQAAAKSRWEKMGLSAEEIQKRTDAQQERQANCDGTGTGGNQTSKGYGRNSR